MSRLSRLDALRVISLLFILEIISVFYLWISDATSLQGQRAFALVLALVLVTFSMISYIRRTERTEEGINRFLILGGCVLAFAILLAGLAL